MIVSSVMRRPVRRLAAAALSRTPNPNPNHMEAASTLTTSTPASTSTTSTYKTIDDLPGPSSAMTAYWLFVEHKRIYGPIWRSHFGPFHIVNVASPELVAQVIRQEGRYPVRVDLPHWREYRDLRGRGYGLTGEEWYRIRQVLNPMMLKPQVSSSYAPTVHQVVGDLLRRLELLSQRSPDATVTNLQDELYKFGFEGEEDEEDKDEDEDNVLKS
ncbi:hypothetical protein NHX12_015311 [Muraenolepis orangiensis]|uniref:Cholesterol side-chain cleavage enzyme, mitochondrial n=1 Tax=Muraenolepis orangiensis TaxID=630683 RepID=A0A9Q0I5Y6_9TELE|nr:hypothetical protein NHX12_015311 [Muraenolepis orangiensis]